MALTNEDIQQVVNALKADAQGVGELAEATSLENVNSLPAIQTVGDDEQMVQVPITMLAAPAIAAAQIANTASDAANGAATAANNAASAASEAADNANAAKQAATLAAADAIGAAAAVNDSLVGSMTSETGEDDTVNIKILNKTGQEIASANIPAGGSGGNTYNVTDEIPLTTGYYTLATAIAAVDNKYRCRGRCVTYEAAQGKWETKQFIGTSLSSWDQPASWEDFGGAGTVKLITVNGDSKSPDDLGNVELTFNETVVDEVLDVESVNPVQNKVAATKFLEVEANTVFSIESELDEETNIVKIAIKNKSGAEIASTEFQGGTGGGGTDSGATKIVLTAAVDKPVMKEGDTAVLSYFYDHQYASGDDKGTSTGQKASIVITMNRGSQVVYSSTLSNVSAGGYSLDISKYLLQGVTDIYVKATTTNIEGIIQTKQAYTSLRVVSLSLSSSYNLATSIAQGGYNMNEIVSIPFTVVGAGVKIVSLYIDGVQTETTTISKSGSTNGSFSIPMSDKSVGRHNIQMVAEMEASETLTLRSESIYIDILKRGSETPFIGLMIVRKDGLILLGNSYLTPKIEAAQYEQMVLKFVAYDASTTPARVMVRRNGQLIQTVSVARTVQEYKTRFTEKGDVSMTFTVAETNYPFTIEVSDSGIELAESTLGLQMKLTASGRSNEEDNPATWTDGVVTTTFTDTDFRTSGWTGDSLKLINGAKAVINFKPFISDAAANGSTIEIEYRVSNVFDKDKDVISCISQNKGFLITGDKSSMLTGSIKDITDEDGTVTHEPVGVSRQFNENEWRKVTFVIGKRSDGRRVEMFGNGTREAADIYSEGDNFMQATPANIVLSSEGSDLEVRTIRVYNRPLSDDEVVDNYIVDAQSVEQMINMLDENDVLSAEGSEIDFTKIRAKGKATILIVRAGGLDPINAENNKSTDFLSDVHIWFPDGRYAYLKNINVRIQGTSSTKYPRKNYRFYCAKGQNPELYVDGVKQESLKIALRPGQKPVKILCPKADYSDSSMVQNTGGANIFNRMMTRLGFLTPPQKVDPSIRVAIDGFPCDLFAAETMDSTPKYYGQYNCNHDKSDWYDIIGVQNVTGFDTSKAITFEFLNNTQPIGLFQVRQDIDAQAEEEFDSALEFNYPKDVTWSTATLEQKKAFKDLWGWVRDCVPAGSDVNNLSSFVSQKFKNEVNVHFDVNFLLAFYLFGDFLLMADQRVKNMIFSCWDLVKWYLLYYDGDTMIGDRNDAFLKYLYNVTRDTWDAEKSKYAFEGHDSYLWCLVLANMQNELKEMANIMRTVLTEEMVNDVFDKEQQANWSKRCYNKSGEVKYIQPQVEGVMVKGELVKYPYIYALKGDKQAFRHHFIKNRFSLLDGKYGTSPYRSDNIDMYMTRTAGSPANSLKIKSNDLFYYAYGTNNNPFIQTVQEAVKDAEITLTFTSAFTVNDPIRIYGASRIAELDMRGIANNITGDMNLNKCVVMHKLDLSTSGSGSTGWCLVLDKCRQLSEVNLAGQVGARTGTLSSTELNFSNQNKMTRLDASGVIVDGIIFAKGAPLVYARMSNSIKTLSLEYLPKLTNDGLIIAGYSNIETFRFAACPNLDVWNILDRCINVKRIRITGIDIDGNGELLDKYLTTGGIDNDGNAISTCSLVGTYRLKKYVDEEKYEEYKRHYPELNIFQPEYTMIEFDDTVSADNNISNLDNNTGYKYANGYTTSGHLNKILAQRYRCLGKQAVKGTMTIYPLHADNSNYYADSVNLTTASPAKLDSTEGDVLMHEPHYWFKGINDFLNNKKYSCYSSLQAMPSIPEAKTISYDDILAAGNVRTSYKLLSGKADLLTSYTADSAYSVCKVNVTGYKKVRFPTVPGIGLMCSIFSDDNGVILDTKFISTLSGKFEPGMYLIADVPQGATWINFTIQKTAEFDKVVLSNSDKIEDMEPDWVEHKACLIGVFETTIVNAKLRSCISGGSSTASMTWTDFNYYSAARNMQQIDYEMHRDIANLFFARYGRRDSQAQCGAGSHNSARTTGGSALRGMTDTIGYDEAYTINPNITKALVDDINPQFAWYKEIDEYGRVTVRQVNNICCLGYEDIYGDKYEMMDNVIINKDTVDYKWIITMPDGSIRKVKGSPTSSMWITGTVHGKYMDIIPAGSISGSNSTFYCDIFYVSGSTSRVVYRGCSYASSNGGVSCASASNDSSYSSSSVGSRLAFRGKIVKALSVSEFKALNEIA